MVNQPRKKVTTSVNQPNHKAPGLLSALGGIAGGYLGGPAGSILGSKAGDLISKITGFGAYKINKNSITEGQSIPSFRLNSEGVEISHREFITDVRGSVNFALSKYAINPGLPSAFPWLSQVAANFEEYTMKGLVYEYRPSSGTAVSNTSASLGTIILATDYNVLAPQFQNKQQMESYEFSSACVPFEPMMHPVECAPGANPTGTLFVRTGQTVLSGDQRLYDMGQLEIAAQGMQSAYTCGELWVTYHVCLKKPRIDPNGVGMFSHITELPSGTASNTHPLGTSGGEISNYSNLGGVSLVGATGGINISRPGNYYISIAQSSGATGLAGVNYTLGSNINDDIGNFWEDSTESDFGILSSDTKFANLDGVFQVSSLPDTGGGSNTITLSGFGTNTTSKVDVWIMPLPYSLS